MKRTTAILLLFAMLLTTHLSISGYASPSSGEEESTTQSPVTDESADPDLPLDPETVDPPVTLPETNDPALPGTTEPPLTEPPLTEPPTTEEPPFTEPAPTEEELLFDALAAVIDRGEQQLEFSTAEQIPDQCIASACTRALERTPRFFYLGDRKSVV